MNAGLPLAPDTLLARNEHLMSTPVDADIVFLNPATDSYVALDAIGRRVWELLEQPRRVSELVDQLKTEFEGSRQQIARDVAGFLAELESEGMVCVIDTPRS